MSTEFDIVVVGAGPAGVAAAVEGAKAGLRVGVIDQNARPGGQIWRGRAVGPDAAIRKAWIDEFQRFEIPLLESTQVVEARDSNTLLVEHDEESALIRYDRLILATGARELFLPFEGWTLPGVMGAGGLQILAKGGLPVSGKRVVLAGSGPLLLAAAAYLKIRGAHVRLIAEQASRGRVHRFGIGLIRWPHKLSKALGLMRTLRSIRQVHDAWPLRARGEERLESVLLRAGGREIEVDCDYLGCGFGLVANTKLASHLGCDLAAGAVLVDRWQRSSLEGVFAAGECTGIGGLELSLAEGRIAGLAASGRSHEAEELFSQRDREAGFAVALEKCYRLHHELKSMAQENTIICRCEDVRWQLLSQCNSWRQAKLQTRCGMGPCQGRVCASALEFLRGWQAESRRPPLFPARLSTLAVPGPEEVETRR